MNTAALRELIQNAHLLESRHGHLARLILSRLEGLHPSINVAGEDASGTLTRFVHAYIEHVPDFLDAANTVARAGAAAPAPTTGTELPSGPSNRFWFLQDRRTRRVIIGLAILVVLFVLRHFTTGGRVPFVRYTPQ